MVTPAGLSQQEIELDLGLAVREETATRNRVEVREENEC